ncbi:MAG: iron-sulfur cluster loop [Ignavibacteria bacterium RIFOXYB2_FULL_35_12]|nr:MAG: iron-sulfur cluster loop [Ignavibacteria bacterium RIFOXYB2_FULL_35_12]
MRHLVSDEEANNFLNNLEESSYAFVLACLMDRQIKAERAWIIPFKVCESLQIFNIQDLYLIPKSEIHEVFVRKRLHRFNDKMSDIFFNGIKDIIEKYDGDAKKIWSNSPSSALVVYRFLEFKGSGIKISTMAANILARQFRIQFSDYYSVDISPDTHIVRVLKRTGIVSKDANKNMIIFKARELNPEFPGIIDYSCWEIGRKWCHSRNPDCENCLINNSCDKLI